MADSTVAALTTAGTLDGTELVYCVKGGADRKTTTQDIVDLVPVVSDSGGGTPGGADTQVQFNDGGVFGGDAGMVFNKTTNALTVTGIVGTGSVTAGNVQIGYWSADNITFSGVTAVIDWASQVSLRQISGNILGLTGGSSAAGGTFEFIEITAPAAPAANKARIWIEDNGSGKTRMMVLFASGAAQQVAIEP